jgi:NAD(P)H-dependent flavin oxidoreductase YrpB (nitropropane dioxygenase family)
LRVHNFVAKFNKPRSHAMKTTLCEKLGIDIPIIQAPMGGAVGPQLTAAVSNAGGLGTIPLWGEDVPTLRQKIHEIRSLTAKPFAVNLNLEFPHEDRLAACLELHVPVISFFWGESTAMIARAKAGGAIVMQTVATAAQAKAAVRSGADIIVAQGWEAGGHVWGTVATMALVPAVVDAVAPVPVVAAGGIADGRGLAAALALGASGAWIGTRFLASPEATIHEHYRSRVLAASGDETAYLENLFDIGWPNAPHRVLRNSTVTDWEKAGRPEPGQRPGEGNILGTSQTEGQLLRYGCNTPHADAEGDIEAMSMWAGQGVGLVRKRQSAAEIVREIYEEASKILRKLGNRDWI